MSWYKTKEVFETMHSQTQVDYDFNVILPYVSLFNYVTYEVRLVFIYWFPFTFHRTGSV